VIGIEDPSAVSAKAWTIQRELQTREPIYLGWRIATLDFKRPPGKGDSSRMALRRFGFAGSTTHSSRCGLPAMPQGARRRHHLGAVRHEPSSMLIDSAVL